MVKAFCEKDVEDVDDGIAIQKLLHLLAAHGGVPCILDLQVLLNGPYAIK